MSARLALVDVSSEMSGVEFSTLYLAQNLERTHWSPLVICPGEGELPQLCRQNEIDVLIVPLTRLVATSVRLRGRRIPNPFALAWNALSFAITARRLAPILEREQIRLVVTKGLLAHYYGGLAARWARIPCVWHVQDRVSERAGALFPTLLSIGARVLARRVIADANSIARQLDIAMPRDRVNVVWNGVDTREFSPEMDGTRVRAEWTHAPDALLIGVIARLVAWKGQHVLLKAMVQLGNEFPNARVILVGSALFDTDEYAQSLKTETTRLGLGERVVFAGFRSDMPEALAALDVVAHTALEKDSTPLAVVSAMASGKAIVCSAVDGTAELFEEGVNGLLFPPGDANALVNQLRLVLGDSALRARLGQNAREFAERELSVEQFTRKCESVFERALEN
ncbi:MAG: glycosyltransferase family 1 protein [Chloroflexota bacterium]|nr:MAG: glycosyltransferase family 1 protein [Chloroflexota bacterium]